MHAERGSATHAPIDLVTTYTTIHPLQRHNVDDFGEEVNEVVYAGTLRFTEDHFELGDIARRIAIASRTSASIRGVFEPSFLPSDPEQAGTAQRPNFACHQPAHAQRTGRWAACSPAPARARTCGAATG